MSTRACKHRPLRLALGAVATLALTAPLHAQALMVGDDGAVHLDEFSEVQANDPVVIEQTPELVSPDAMPGEAVPGPVFQPGNPLAVDASNVPFMPGTPFIQPMVAGEPAPIMHSVFGEFLYLHPTGVDLAHAVQVNGAGAQFGRVGVTDFHYEPGVRVGGDMAVSQTSSLAATYTYFESNAASRVTAPVIAGGAVASLVHPHTVALAASPGPVDARSVLDFQLADAEYRTRLDNGPNYWLNAGFGLRFGRLEQEFGQVGAFGGAPGGLIVTQADVDFDGGGPKFAIDGGRSLGTRGLSLYSRAGVSPLAGQFHSAYRLRNDTTDVQLAEALWNDDRLVTLLEYEVGLAWTGPRRRWRFAAGYTTTHWFNAVTTGEFIHATQTGDFDSLGDTITFSGLVARVEHLW